MRTMMALLTVVILVAAGSAAGEMLTVKPDGSEQFTSIQAAIDSAANGDTIMVYAGEYIEDIRIYEKTIVLKGEGPGEVMLKTDLTGAAVVYWVYAEGVFEGFHVVSTGNRIVLCRVESVGNLLIRDCYFDGGVVDGADVRSIHVSGAPISTPIVTVERCWFDGSLLNNASTAGSSVSVDQCVFVNPDYLYSIASIGITSVTHSIMEGADEGIWRYQGSLVTDRNDYWDVGIPIQGGSTNANDLFVDPGWCPMGQIVTQRVSSGLNPAIIGDTLGVQFVVGGGLCASVPDPGEIIPTDVDLAVVPMAPTINVAPNPFNPSTTVSFSAPLGQHLSIVVYDVTGRLVSTLYDGAGGQFSIRWDAADSPSGTYFVRMTTETISQVRKVNLLR